MAQPTAYTRQFDFENHSTNYPTTPQPGVQLESELDAIKLTTDEIRTNMALLQRDDGKLANQSVGLAQLETGLVVGINPATNWLTATAYDEGDTVYQGNNLYYCVVAHTSGVFATDLAAVKWSLVINFDQYVSAASVDADDAAASAAAALVSENNASTSEGNASTSAGSAASSLAAAVVAKDAAVAAQVAAEAAAGSLNFATIQGGDAGKYAKVNATENGYDYITPPTIPVKATSGELNTGTDDAKFATADGLAASDYGLATVTLWCSAPAEAVSTGIKMYYDIPVSLNGMNLVSVNGKAVTAGTTGNMTIDVNRNGTTMMAANKLVFATGVANDNGTAVISAPGPVATGDVIAVEVDAIQTTPAVGVRVNLGFRKP